MNSLIENVIIKQKQNITKNHDDIIYTLSTTENQKDNKNKNVSNIDLGLCETMLKNHYHINENETLLILKIDIYKKELLIPIVEYEVYNIKTKGKIGFKYM